MSKEDWAAFGDKLGQLPAPPPRRRLTAVSTEQPGSTPDDPPAADQPADAAHLDSAAGGETPLTPEEAPHRPESVQDLEQQLLGGPRPLSRHQPPAPPAGTPQPAIRATSTPAGKQPAAPPTQPARRFSVRQLAQQRAADEHTRKLATVLTSAGLNVQPTDAHLEGDLFQVTLAPADQDIDAVLGVLEQVAAAFGVDDMDVETAPGAVRLFIQIVESGPAKQAAVWVPAQLRELVRAHTSRTGESVTQVVLAAFNAYCDQLDALFAPAPQHSDGPMEVSATRRRAGLDTPVQLWMYLKPGQRARLDNAVRTCGAASRSDLVTVLLERFFEVDTGSEPAQ